MKWRLPSEASSELFKSVNLDNIHHRVLKELGQDIAGLRGRILSKSINLGEVLCNWRIANTVPIFKRKKKGYLGSYKTH